MRGVDGDRDSDLGEGRFSSGSENEEESGGGVEISDGIAGTHDSLRFRARLHGGRAHQ